MIHFLTTGLITENLILNNMYVTHAVCLTLMFTLEHILHCLLFFIFVVIFCLYLHFLWCLVEVNETQKTYVIKVYESHFWG